MKKLILLAALIFLAYNGTTRAGQIAQAPDIRLPEVPTPAERHAQAELAHFIQAMTGWSLDSPIESSPVIEIGRTEGNLAYLQTLNLPDERSALAGRDTYLVVHDGSTLRLCGANDRATLYATYAWLRLQGCRWYFPGELGQIIPQRTSLDLPDSPILSRPQFLVREIDKIQGHGVSDLEAMDWASRNGLNRQFSLHRKWSDASARGGQVLWHRLAHNYEWMLPVDEYFDEHPECYPLYHGRRIPLGMDRANICTTHPEVISTIASAAGAWYDRHTTGSLVPLSPPDGLIRWCECTDCSALGGKNFTPGPMGSMSRRHTTFVNAVARQLAETHPDRELLLLAYQNYQRPPAPLKLGPNIKVQVARTGDLLRPIDADTDMGQTMSAWSADGIWDYALLADGDATMPLPVARSLGESIQWMAEQGYSDYYFIQASTSIRHNPLAHYLIAQLTWDPRQSIDELIATFCTDLYGPAAEPMLAYWLFLEESARQSPWQPTFWRDLTHPPSSWLSPTVLAQLDDLLSQAEAAAPDGPFADRITLARDSYLTARDYVAPTLEPSLRPLTVTLPEPGTVQLSADDRPLLYPGDYLRSPSGRLGFSVCLDALPKDKGQIISLFSAGRKGTEGWLQLYLSADGQLGWLWTGSTHTEKPGEKPYYFHLHSPVEIATNQWHHIEIAWDQPAQHLSLRLDGKVLEQRDNASYSHHFWPSSIGIGCSTAALQTGRVQGQYRDLKIEHDTIQVFHSLWNDENLKVRSARLPVR